MDTEDELQPFVTSSSVFQNKGLGGGNPKLQANQNVILNAGGRLGPALSNNQVAGREPGLSQPQGAFGQNFRMPVVQNNNSGVQPLGNNAQKLQLNVFSGSISPANPGFTGQKPNLPPANSGFPLGKNLNMPASNLNVPNSKPNENPLAGKNSGPPSLGSAGHSPSPFPEKGVADKPSDNLSGNGSEIGKNPFLFNSNSSIPSGRPAGPNAIEGALRPGSGIPSQSVNRPPSVNLSGVAVNKPPSGGMNPVHVPERDPELPVPQNPIVPVEQPGINKPLFGQVGSKPDTGIPNQNQGANPPKVFPQNNPAPISTGMNFNPAGQMNPGNNTGLINQASNNAAKVSFPFGAPQTIVKAPAPGLQSVNPNLNDSQSIGKAPAPVQAIPNNPNPASNPQAFAKVPATGFQPANLNVNNPQNVGRPATPVQVIPNNPNPVSDPQTIVKVPATGFQPANLNMNNPQNVGRPATSVQVVPNNLFPANNQQTIVKSPAPVFLQPNPNVNNPQFIDKVPAPMQAAPNNSNLVNNPPSNIKAPVSMQAPPNSYVPASNFGVPVRPASPANSPNMSNPPNRNPVNSNNPAQFQKASLVQHPQNIIPKENEVTKYPDYKAGAVGHPLIIKAPSGIKSQPIQLQMIIPKDEFPPNLKKVLPEEILRHLESISTILIKSLDYNMIGSMKTRFFDKLNELVQKGSKEAGRILEIVNKRIKCEFCDVQIGDELIWELRCGNLVCGQCLHHAVYRSVKSEFRCPVCSRIVDKMDEERICNSLGIEKEIIRREFLLQEYKENGFAVCQQCDKPKKEFYKSCPHKCKECFADLVRDNLAPCNFCHEYIDYDEIIKEVFSCDNCGAQNYFVGSFGKLVKDEKLIFCINCSYELFNLGFNERHGITLKKLEKIELNDHFFRLCGACKKEVYKGQFEQRVDCEHKVCGDCQKEAMCKICSQGS